MPTRASASRARARAAAALVKKPTGCLVIEATELEHGKSRRGERCDPGFAGPGGEDHGHRIGRQLTGREQQRISGRRVEPLSVVHHTQQRRADLGGLGQHGQGRDPDQERLDGESVLDAERDPQRPRLWGRQPVKVGDGTQKAVKRGVRQR
jgi:hypothetical protein